MIGILPRYNTMNCMPATINVKLASYPGSSPTYVLQNVSYSSKYISGIIPRNVNL